MDEALEQGRRIAFGRFVKRATDQWLTQNHEQGMRELADYLELSTPTLYRWINGSWKRDPSRDSVDRFCRRLRIDSQVAYDILGWGKEAPERSATPPPQMDPDIEQLLRKLENPKVPDAEKQFIRESLRRLNQYRPPGFSDDKPDTGT